MKADLEIALIQSPLFWEDPKKNLAYFREKISTLKGLDLVLLPEMFNTGFSMNSAKLAEQMHGPSMQWMQQLAKECKIVLCGSLIISENAHFYNRLIWMRPDGSYETYDKRHLFRMANEDAHFTAGTKQLIVELKGWKIFPQICYDLRFPVWSRNKFKTDRKSYAEASYDLCFYIANWPQARISAWSTLLRARAIENQAYIIGLNRTGEDGNKIAYNGMSAVVDAKGDTIEDLGSQIEKTVTCSLKYAVLQEFRQKFPVGMDADEFEWK